MSSIIDCEDDGQCPLGIAVAKSTYGGEWAHSGHDEALLALKVGQCEFNNRAVTGAAEHCRFQVSTKHPVQDTCTAPFA